MWKRYHRIMEAEEDNPKVAEVLKEDLELKNQRDKLVGRIRASRDKKKTKKLAAELEDIVGQRFDLIIKRKQLEYERLRGRLKRLQSEVERKEAELQKNIDRKPQEVKERIEELLKKSEGIEWE